MEPGDNAQIEAALTAIRGALRDAVLGVYQYGSAVSSGLRSKSDLDILVVISRPTSGNERKALVRDLLQCSRRDETHISARPLEVTVVRRDAVSPWPTAPERELQFGEWLRHEYETGTVPGPVVDHDLAPLLSTALHRSRTLHGPALDQLISPIPQDELIAAMRAGVPAMLADLAEDTRNVLLTLARIWYTTCTGTVVSKDVAAAWALQRIPPALRKALAHARAAYLGETAEDFTTMGAAPLDVAEFMATRIADPGG